MQLAQVRWASVYTGIIHRTDYWRRGRNLDKLGINALSVGEINRYVMEGKR